MLQEIDLTLIEVSKTNPRKSFDMNALEELAKSISAHGVFQPILVRPNPLQTPEHPYMLVCGERRYRASIMARVQSIPVNIRELTDDEAFELQIIENLERKDVHPLDEADAFKKMLDSGRYQLADIAAKMAKTEKFIMQRLKLNDLIPEIQKDFFDNVLAIGQAVLISKLQSQDQQEIYTDYKDRNVSGYGTLAQLQKEISHKYFELDTAIFSIEKDFEHAKACTGCAHRSINNPLLFEEMQSGDSCFNKSCFQAKTDSHVTGLMMDILESGRDILFGVDWRGKPTEKVAAIAAEYKLNILENHSNFFTHNSAGRIKKQLLFVGGSQRGNILDVYIPTTATAIKVASGSTPSKNLIEAEIKRIEDVAKRALELDEEKIHTAIKESLKKEINEKQARHFVLPDDFVFAMAMHWAIETIGSWTLKEVMKQLAIEFNQGAKNYDELHDAIFAIKPKDRIRLMVYITFQKTQQSSHKNSLYGQLIRKLALCNDNVPVAEIEAKQKEAADKRIARNQERINDLKKQAEKGKAKPVKQ